MTCTACCPLPTNTTQAPPLAVPLCSKKAGGTTAGSYTTVPRQQQGYRTGPRHTTWHNIEQHCMRIRTGTSTRNSQKGRKAKGSLKTERLIQTRGGNTGTRASNRKQQRLLPALHSTRLALPNPHKDQIPSAAMLPYTRKPHASACCSCCCGSWQYSFCHTQPHHHHQPMAPTAGSADQRTAAPSHKLPDTTGTLLHHQHTSHRCEVHGEAHTTAELTARSSRCTQAADKPPRRSFHTTTSLHTTTTACCVDKVCGTPCS
jgi:hypothetical protein